MQIIRDIALVKSKKKIDGQAAITKLQNFQND
jgi:hypothetical protein